MDNSDFAVTGQTLPKPVVSPIQPQQTSVASNSGQQIPSSQPSPQGGLDPQAVALAQAVRQTESGGNFQAKGASGEYGAYQWMPNTWAAQSKTAGINVPLEQATPVQQNQVAYTQIKAWKDQGYNVGQIASMWNAGPGAPNAYQTGNAGTNSQGVSYDTVAYAQKVAENYQQFKTQQPQMGVNQPTQESAPSVGGFIGNTIQSGANLLGNIGNAVLHPIQTVENIGGMGVGALQELGGQTNDNTAKFDALKHYLAQRYGGVDNLLHTAYTDPIGLAADISAVFGVGAGVAGAVSKVGKLGEIADVAGTVSNSLGKVSAVTNPLTPLVKGAGALLNSTKNLSDVIAHPTDYTPEQIANSSSEKVVGDVQDAFSAKRAALSETGSEYTPLRNSSQHALVGPTDLAQLVEKNTGAIVDQNGTVIEGGKLTTPLQVRAIQSFLDTWEPKIAGGDMTADDFLTMRSYLNTKLAKFGKELTSDKTLKSVGESMYADLNKTYRPSFPGLEQMDSSFSSQIKNINDLEDGLIYKTGANKGELKTSFLNSSLRAVKNADTDKLAQLEEIVPGITKRLQVMKTLKDLGHPSFTTSLVEKGGVVGGLITGNLPGAAMALTSIILSQPEIALPLLRGVGASLPLVKLVMANLAKSLTIGAVGNNAQEANPQTQTAPGANSQDQQTIASPTVQSGNSSDLTQLAASKGFDLQKALSAGYTSQDIEQFLQTQQ